MEAGRASEGESTRRQSLDLSHRRLYSTAWEEEPFQLLMLSQPEIHTEKHSVLTHSFLHMQKSIPE